MSYVRDFWYYNHSVKLPFCLTTFFVARLQEFVQCIVNTDPGDYTSPVPDMLHFMLAYEWQLMVITKKAGLCKDMPTDELKKITMVTGIVSGFALYYGKFTIPVFFFWFFFFDVTSGMSLDRYHRLLTRL